MRWTRVLRTAVGPHKNTGNITGFDIKAFQAAGDPKNRRYDPWERNEAWRYTGTFSRWNRWKRTLPGIGWGTGAFVLYCVYEEFFMEPVHHTKSEDHDDDHE